MRRSIHNITMNRVCWGLIFHWSVECSSKEEQCVISFAVCNWYCIYWVSSSIYQKRTGQDKGERNTMVVVSPFDEIVQGDLTDAIEDILEKFHQAFLGCSLSASNLSQLVNNRKKIHCLYQGELN